MLRVIYSNGARFAGGGIGNTSYHAVKGLNRHRYFHQLLCGSFHPTEIPKEKIKSLGILSRLWRKVAVYDRSHYLDYSYRRYYDRWSAHKLSTCDIFQAWSGYSLQALKQAREMGIATVLDRALAHPIYLNKLLKEEYEKWGLPYKAALTANRTQQEIATADYILIPSDFVRQTFKAQGEDEEKLIQIPFGVDVTRFHPPTRARKAKPFRALFMGHISIRKGVPYLLEAWRKLRWQDAQLWLAGQVQLPADLMRRYQDLDNVHFLGYLTNTVEVFQKANVFVFPSIAEGSALVNYEAMATGLPVITTLNAGSILRHGQGGFFVPIQDVDAIASRLEQLRSDNQLRLKMGNTARSRALEFSWEQYGDNLVNALHNIKWGTNDRYNK